MGEIHSLNGASIVLGGIHRITNGAVELSQVAGLQTYGQILQVLSGQAVVDALQPTLDERDLLVQRERRKCKSIRRANAALDG